MGGAPAGREFLRLYEDRGVKVHINDEAETVTVSIPSQ